jgi:phage baseplate assembly protein W
MAIKDTSKKPYIIDRDSNVTVGIDLPVRIGSEDGAIAGTSTTIEAVKNNIRNLLQTNPGERLMQPNLGVELRNIIFEPITESTLLLIQDTILDSFELWLPFVEVKDIQIINDNSRTDINQVAVKIDFNIKRDPSTSDSVSINFSSNVEVSANEVIGGISSGGGY